MKKIYTILIVILPILSIYKSGIPSIDIGTLSLIVMFILLVITGKVKSRFYFPKEWGLYLIYIIFNMLIIYPIVMHYQENSSIILRMSKYILYVCIYLYCACNEIFDLEYALKIYKRVCIFAITFICIQSILHYIIGIDINGVIYKLIMLDSYAERATITTHVVYRPTSIFLEPSHYFDYTMMFLIISLFKNREIRSKDFFAAIYVSIGMIVSTSGQAVLYSIIIWGIWVIRLIYGKNRKKIIYIITIIPTMIIAFVVLYKTSFVQSILERIFNKNVVGGNAVDARAIGFEYFNDQELFNKIFGNGYGNTPDVFFSSMSFNLFCLGILGTIFVVYIYLKCFKKTSIPYIKVLIFILFIVSIGNTTFMSVSAAFFFSFIYASIYKEKNILIKKEG